MTTQTTFRLWDLPTRLFHWLFAAAVIAAVITGQVGGNWMVWHGRLGILIVALLGFRLLWGFFGSTYARFGSFLPTPAKILAYLRGQWQGAGHNPLGALSVFALLGVVAAQVVLGLFTNDEIAFKGPLASLVSSAQSLQMTEWHRQFVPALILLSLLHIGSIVFYRLVKKHDLVTPMITGKGKTDAQNPAADARGGGPLAFVLALACALLLAWSAAGGLLAPPPPPPPAEDIPAW